MDQLFLLLVLWMGSIADDDPSTWKPCGECSCRSSKKEYEADCSHQYLQDIPQTLPRNITVLRAKNSSISELSHKCIINYSLLELLDLSDNNLTSFHIDTFVGARKLKRLILHNNGLPLDKNTYPRGLFRGLKHLEALDISKNDESVATVVKLYPDETFRDLISLEELFLDGVENVTFGPGFTNLDNLIRLSLSGENGYCAIYNLLNNSFENLPSVTHLDIRKCIITSIDANAFLPLKNSIIDLDLSDNIYLGFESFGKSLYGLRFSSLMILRINRIVTDYVTGVILRETDLKYLTNLTNLKEVYADDNRIEAMDDTVPNLFVHVEILSMVRSCFTFGAYIYSFDGMTSLRKIYFMNRFTPRRTRLIDTVEHFQEPQLNASLVNRDTVNDLDNQNNSKTDNNIKHSGPRFQFPLPPRVYFINASNSYIKNDIFELYFSHNDIKQLDLSRNMISRWIGPVHETQTLEFLDLSENYCTEINPKFLANATKLKILNFTKNRLATSLESDVNGLIFFNQTNLTELRIGFNSLIRLPKQIFNRQAKLKILDLRWNMMETWDVKISHMKQLSSLDLEKNRFETVPMELRQQIDIIMKGRKDKFSLNLNYNNLKCGCDDLDYLIWLTKNYIILEDKMKTSCKLSNGSATTMNNLQDLVLLLQKKCKVIMPFLIGSLSGLFLILGLVVAGVVYRHRWKLRYMYCTLRRRYRGYQRINQQESQFTYDAFVSFADEDRDFVVDEMRRKLEDQHGLKLCIHQRDFMVGEAITANIINAIQTSRKTIVVLSPNFIASSWCEYEVRMARMESIHTKRNVLCVLWYADIPNSREISMDLLEEIVTDTYIKYPTDEEDRTLFWTTLKESLLY